MNRKYRKTWFMMIFLLLFGTSYMLTSADGAEKKTVDVMFLHDTHSHLNEFETVEDGKSQSMGGFSRIMTLIKKQKEKNPDTLLLDAGDFSMGTLIQVV